MDGTVEIKHKLTRRKVTLSAGPYDRGVSAGLPSEAAGDPLEYAREHVVYLDGDIPGGKPSGIAATRRIVPIGQA